MPSSPTSVRFDAKLKKQLQDLMRETGKSTSELTEEGIRYLLAQRCPTCGSVKAHVNAGVTSDFDEFYERFGKELVFLVVEDAGRLVAYAGKLLLTDGRVARLHRVDPGTDGTSEIVLLRARIVDWTRWLDPLEFMRSRPTVDLDPWGLPDRYGIVRDRTLQSVLEKPIEFHFAPPAADMWIRGTLFAFDQSKIIVGPIDTSNLMMSKADACTTFLRRHVRAVRPL